MSLVDHITALATAIGNMLRESVLPRLLPSGGAAGQALVKSGGTDYAVQWADPASGGGGGGGSYFGATMVLKPAPGAVIGNTLTAQSFTQSMSANSEDVSPFIPGFDFSIDMAYISVSGGAASTTARIVIYESDADGRPTGAPTLSDSVSTAAAATVGGAISFEFEAGRLYWVGVRTSGGPQLRVAQPYAHFGLAWSTAATPARSAVLKRSIAIDSVADYPTFSNALIHTNSPPMVYMRVA